MKKRYILLIFIILTILYFVWCNISIIYTKAYKEKGKVELVSNVKYATDSFSTGNTTVFWQGFYHDWKYNHRVNRLGDWINEVNGNLGKIESLFNHSAASGSGADELDYTTYFTFLKSEYIRTFSSLISTEIRGREATTTSKNITVKGVWPSALKNYKKGIVVLNGFDIFSRTTDDGDIKGSGVADKLSQLFIEVDNLKIYGDSFEFDLNIKFGADCDSPECLSFTPGDNEWFDYQLSVAYQIIGYDNAVHTSQSNIKQYYTWRKPFKTKPSIDPNEIFREEETIKNKILNGNAGYNVGIPLINKIDINLPKGKGGILRRRMETPHLLSLDLAITDYNYNESTGACNIDADLFFKNWKTNMHALSYGNDGKAIINMGIQLLQINDPYAIVENKNIKGEIKWETSHIDQRPANHPNSIKTFKYSK